MWVSVLFLCFPPVEIKSYEVLRFTKTVIRHLAYLQDKLENNL